MMDKGDLIRKEDGNPFADKRAASRQQTILERQGIITKAVELERGGFALEVLQNKRPKRVPLAARSVWSPKHEPGFVYRGVNDDPRRPGRIEMFKEAGWEVVTGDDPAADERVGRTSQPGSAVTVPGGNDVTMVLMRKRSDWFEEDFALKQEAVDASERGLQQRVASGDLHAASGYTRGIKIKQQGN